MIENENSFDKNKETAVKILSEFTCFAQKDLYEKTEDFEGFYSWHQSVFQSLVKRMIEHNDSVAVVGSYGMMALHIESAYIQTRLTHADAPYLIFRARFIDALNDGVDRIRNQATYSSFKSFVTQKRDKQ